MTFFFIELLTVFFGLGDIQKLRDAVGVKDFVIIYGFSHEKLLKCLENTEIRVNTHFKIILMQFQSKFEAKLSILGGQIMEKCLEYL